MFNRLSMKWRVFLPIIILVAVAFTAFSVLNFLNTKSTLEKMTYTSLEQESIKTSTEILTEVNKASIEVDNMAKIVQAWVDQKKLDRDTFSVHFNYWVNSNKFLKGAWADWVPGKFGDDEAKNGRFTLFWARDDKGVPVLQDPYKWEDVMNEPYFARPQEVKDLIMIDPYLDDVNGKKQLLTSISIPIYNKGDFLGVVGCDFGISSIQETFEKSRPFEKGLSRLITSSGKIAADIDSGNLNKPWPIEKEAIEIQEKMKRGEPFYLQSYEPFLKEEAVKYFRPVKMGRSPELWYYASVVPMSALKKESNNLFLYQVGGAVLVTIVIAALVWMMISSISKKIEAITENVASGATEVTRVSQVIAEAQKDLNAVSQEQAALLTQTTESVNQISLSITENSNKANESNQLLTECHEKGERGSAIVSEMVDSIVQIKDSNISMLKKMEANFEEINSIVQVINVIQEKTNVINDIVFQTKLLAFNASVEAARAGELGKGFSVVAEEVGNLANMSGKASKEITDIILDGSTQINRIIAQTKTSNEKMSADNMIIVEKGTVAAQKCGEVLSEIISGVQLASTKATEIKEGTNAQDREAKEINQAMKILEEASEKNMNVSGRISQTVVVLGEQSSGLNEQVDELNRIVKGG